MAINPDDFSPAIVMDCQTKQVTSIELSPDEKQRRIMQAAEHEAKEQQKAADKAAADATVAVWKTNPQSSAKVGELLTVLKLLGLDSASLVGQTKSG